MDIKVKKSRTPPNVRTVRLQYAFEWDPEVIQGEGDAVASYNSEILTAVKGYLADEAAMLEVPFDKLTYAVSFEIMGRGARTETNGVPDWEDDWPVFEEFRVFAPQVEALIETLRAIADGDFEEYVRDAIDSRGKSLPVFYEPTRVRLYVLSDRDSNLPAGAIEDVSVEADWRDIEIRDVPKPVPSAIDIQREATRKKPTRKKVAKKPAKKPAKKAAKKQAKKPAAKTATPVRMAWPSVPSVATKKERAEETAIRRWQAQRLRLAYINQGKKAGDALRKSYTEDALRRVGQYERNRVKREVAASKGQRTKFERRMKRNK